MKKKDSPIYITRPLLPDLSKVSVHIEDVWSSKWLTNMGEQHHKLEFKLKEFLKVNFLTLVSNGTLGLMIALKALDLKGEVITTPFTFPATPHSIIWNNLTPVFCDIEDEFLTIDSSKIESLINEKTSAILGVHVFGNPCNVFKIEEIANRYNLKVIYDGAHVFATEYYQKNIGHYGDITMLSFHSTKMFHTLEGGALIYKDQELKGKLNLLKNFGIKNEEEIELVGLNAKLNEVQCAIGIEVLELVNSEIRKRKMIRNAYQQLLDNIEGINVIGIKDQCNSSYQYFAVLVDSKLYGKNRDELYSYLKEYNVYSRKYFYPLCSNYLSYKELPSSSVQNLPVANQKVKQVLCLPFYGDLGFEDVDYICDLIKQFGR